MAEGMEQTVESLFDEATEEEDFHQKTFKSINGPLMNFGDIEAEQAWWVYRMMTTRAPLREKLTLFWHGHFATSFEKVDNSRLMHQQVETIRRHAWGNVRELTLAIARDPAMVVWLDGESNTKEHPNENFARELMELFTCGIGHYTESDVREAARAFTGWHREKTQFAFSAGEHDAGRKHFLGKLGRFDGSDIIDILMQQPATLHFLARKLLRFFAAPEPPEPVIAAAAALLDRTRLDVKWFLRELFQSRFFYSRECYRTRIASPVEFAVGTIRTMSAVWPAPEVVEFLGRMDQRLLRRRMSRAGTASRSGSIRAPGLRGSISAHGFSAGRGQRVRRQSRHRADCAVVDQRPSPGGRHLGYGPHAGRSGRRGTTRPGRVPDHEPGRPESDAVP